MVLKCTIELKSVGIQEQQRPADVTGLFLLITLKQKSTLSYRYMPMYMPPK